MNDNLHVFIDPHISTTIRSYTTLDWILVSYHPADVFTSINKNYARRLGNHSRVFLSLPHVNVFLMNIYSKGPEDEKMGIKSKSNYTLLNR